MCLHKLISMVSVSSEDMGREEDTLAIRWMCVCVLQKTSLQAKLFCSLNHTGAVFFAVTLLHKELYNQHTAQP